MFGWVSNAASAVASFVGGIGQRLGLTGAYDAAMTTGENARHWNNSDALSPLASADWLTRKTIRERARYEATQNNGLARGIVSTLINDLVGRGPRLQVLTKWHKINRRVEKRFSQWMEDVNLAQKLRVMLTAQVIDGESFAHFITNDSLPGVKLDLQLTECDQFTSPFHNFNWYLVDGIEFNDSGHPVAYHRLKEHPGGGFSLAPILASDRLPASQVIHLFREDRPGQVRGVSELAPALPLLAILRRYLLATLMKEENAANISGFLKTPTVTGTPPLRNNAPFAGIDVERNLWTVLPDGYEMSQFKSEVNATTLQMFRAVCVNEIGRCVDMPYNLAALDSSKYNFASGRLDHLPYFRSLRTRQQRIEIGALNRIGFNWFYEASRIPGFLPNELRKDIDAGQMPPHAWFWDTNAEIDIEKETKARTERLNNMTGTLRDELAAKGIDWYEHLLQKRREVRLQKEWGIYVQPAGTPPAPEVETPEEEPKSETEDANATAV